LLLHVDPTDLIRFDIRFDSIRVSSCISPATRAEITYVSSLPELQRQESVSIELSKLISLLLGAGPTYFASQVGVTEHSPRLVFFNTTATFKVDLFSQPKSQLQFARPSKFSHPKFPAWQIPGHISVLAPDIFDPTRKLIWPPPNIC
jgi:hypothetical protein